MHKRVSKEQACDEAEQFVKRFYGKRKSIPQKEWKEFLKN